MQTSKSPRMVAVAALRIGERSLPRYAHRFAPHTFTQPQLFACLVLKCFFRTDYRGIVAILHDAPLLRQTLGLSRVPHFTTLQKAAQRLLRFSRAATKANASRPAGTTMTRSRCPQDDFAIALARFAGGPVPS